MAVVVIAGSKLSAADLVAKIKARKEIPEQIRTIISVAGSSVNFKHEGPQAKFKSKDDAARFTPWAELYVEMEVAANYQRGFAFTSGYVLRLVSKGSATTPAFTFFRLRADPPDAIGISGHGEHLPASGQEFRLSQIGQSLAHTYPSVSEARQLSSEERPVGGGPFPERQSDDDRFVADKLANKRSLIVVANRLVTQGKQGSPPIEDYEIVRQFFHELALHAGGIAQKKVGYMHDPTSDNRVKDLEKLLDKLMPSHFEWPEPWPEPPPAKGEEEEKVQPAK